MRKVLSKTSIVLFAATLLIVGCKNEAEQIFKLEMPQYTGEDKTTFGTGNTTLWTPNDPVLINGVSGNVQSSSSISFSDPVAPVDKMFYSLYPGRATAPSFNGTNGYTFTMPTSFSYSENQLQAPMVGQCAYISSDATHTIQYSNIFTLLKLEFVVIPSEVTITSENTAIAGDFTATYANGSWTVTAPAATTANKTLTITNPNWASVMYVPLPAGSHKLTIEGTSNVSGTNVATPFYKVMGRAVNMQKGVFYPIKCAHAFSVSANKKVFISPGNLQYYNTSEYAPSLGNARWDGDGINGNSRFRFAQHQWDNNITSNNIVESRPLLVTYHDVRGGGAWIDLFGWATGMNPGRSRTTSLAYSGSGAANDFADWGNNSTNPLINAKTNDSWRTWHTEGSWYTLGKTEWEYLIARSNKWKLATVNGTAGLILAPDDFTGTLQTSYSGNAWTNLEKRGVVFLPGSGYRHYGEGITRSWGYSSDWNGYWTLTDSEEYGDYYAYFMKFTTSGTPSVGRPSVSHSGTINSNKPTGLCVRLVQNAN